MTSPTENPVVSCLRHLEDSVDHAQHFLSDYYRRGLSSTYAARVCRQHAEYLRGAVTEASTVIAVSSLVNPPSAALLLARATAAEVMAELEAVARLLIEEAPL